MRRVVSRLTVLAIIGVLGAALPRDAVGQTPESFTPEIYYDTQSTADDLKVADLNADGHLDIVVLDAGARTLFEYFGNGDGTFQPPVGVTAGYDHPTAFALGDVNGDGRVDALVADGPAAKIDMLLGMGDGTFIPTMAFPLPWAPVDIELADVDVDGDLDLVFPSGANELVLMYGNGAGSFASFLALPQAHNPDKVLVSDLNGDGRPDFVLRQNGLITSYLGIVLSSGPGLYAPTAWFTFNGQLLDVAIGELNGDGHPDLVISNPASGGGILTLQNNGAGGFPFLTGVSTVPQQPVVAASVVDIDGDGDGDFPVLFAQKVMIGINDQLALPAPVALTSRTLSVMAIGDFNGDGLVDIAATVTSPGAFGVWLTQAEPPVTTIALAPATADGSNGWYRSPVHVTVSAADNAGGSGLAMLRCSLDPAATPAGIWDLSYPCDFRGSGGDVIADGAHGLYAASMDAAQNVEAVKSTTIRIDRTAPVVTCPATLPSFVRYTVGALVTGTVSDAASGPLAMTVSATADTSNGGTHQIQLTGFDVAGNSAQVTCSYLVTGLPGDRDGDDMSDEDEAKFGLDPDDADGVNGATGDADGDGLINIKELNERPQSHPNGRYVQQFAEGATGFFETTVGILNAGDAAARILVTLLPEGGGADVAVSKVITLAAHTRHTLDLNAEMGASNAGRGVAMRIESDQPIAAMRDMRWRDTQGIVYGSTLERGAPGASEQWYFAEGATGAFSMYLLLSNPGAIEANVTIDSLREDGSPLSSTVTVPGYSRKTIDMKSVPGLAAAAFSTVVSADQPIVAERAMYVSFTDRVFDAGTGGLGMTMLGTQWTFAEGATGFFDTFLLLGNPGTQDAKVTLRYALADGSSLATTHIVPAHARRTIDPASEDPRLAAATFSTMVTSGQPLMAERAMWWGRPWYEGDVSLGTAQTGTLWAIGEGREGGDDSDSTFVLVSNASETDGVIEVTVIDDAGVSQHKSYALAGKARLTLRIGDEFPTTKGSRFSVLVESQQGDQPSAAPIVVECARYQSASGRFAEGGGAALATLIRKIS